MSLRQRLRNELDAIDIVAKDMSDCAWWQMLEDTVTMFAERYKLSWVNSNYEVHKWLATKKRIQAKEDTGTTE